MTTLSLSYLGPFQASLGKQEAHKFRSSKAQALLVYLTTEDAMHSIPQSHRREALMDLLWPGLPLKSSQVNLRQILYRLRQAIPGVKAKHSEEAVPLLISDRQSVQINPEAEIELDLAQFCAIVNRNPTPEKLVNAVKLYRDDFLSDFYLPDSEVFEDWAISIRTHLRQKVFEALEDLSNHYIERGEYEQAIVYARRLLDLDDLHEQAYQLLMFALVLDGQRNTALLQYQIYSQHLQDELGIAPSAKTTALYEQIKANTLREAQEKAPQISPVREGMPIFLFTDIQSSTPMWEEYREAMLTALLHHNEILTGQIRKHQGRILELRGDGVKAVFEGVNPLPCVLAIQQAFGTQDWGEVGDVRIRIGLHGTPQNREGQEYFLKGDQYYGPALHHAARIMDAGHGGQILVSRQVRDAFPLPPDATWQDFGFHELKGVEEPQQIFGLLHPGLPLKDFPPLRTLSAQVSQAKEEPAVLQAVPNNLRSQATHFIGREEEIADLDRLIADPEIRLISIVGPGGIGKTRLAIAVAEKQLMATNGEDNRSPRFPNGVFFVPLAALNSHEYIVPTLAEAIGFPMQRNEEDTRLPKQQVLDYLREKKMLLIFDNFEHLLEGVVLLSEISREAPAVTTLVTSRERLLLIEEHLYPIQGLRFPDWERPDDTAEYTAAKVFLQAARRVQPNFVVKNEDLRYLVRICALVDGTPLALELAASWVDILTLQDIAAEITQSLDFLETAWRDMPERHRSMRATMEASWHRLSPVEQDAFTRLSVFRGSFSRQAAREVTQTSLRTLAVLVNKSLLQYDRNEDRYDLHELMRQFSAEKLFSDGERFTETMDRHSAFYCTYLQKLEAEVKGDWQWFVPVGIESTFENVRAAWMWAVENRKVDRLDKAAFGLYFLVESFFTAREGKELCQAATHALKSLLSVHESAQNLRILARIEIIQGIWCFYRDDRDQAIALFNHSHELLEDKKLAQVDTKRETAFHLFLTGYLFNYYTPDIGIPLQQESLELYRSLNFTWETANTLRTLGEMAVRAGDLSKAKEWLEESLGLFRELGNQPETLRVLMGLGTLARESVDFEKAKQYFERAKVQAQGNPRGEGSVYRRLAWLEMYQGRLDKAATFTMQSKHCFQEFGDMYGVAGALAVGGMTAIHWLSGRFNEACDAMNQCIAIYDALEKTGPTADSMAILAEITACAGNYSAAREYAEKALLMAEHAVINVDTIARSFRALGWIAIAEMDYIEAKTKLIKACSTFRDMKDQWGKEYLVFTLAPLIRVEIGLNNKKHAVELAVEALDIAVTNRAFLPLLILMPVLSYLLSELDHLERAVEILAMAEKRPFVTNSQLMQQTVCLHVREASKQLPTNEVDAAQARGQKLDWWETAEALSAELQTLQK